jgi:TonB family protein
MTPVIDTIIRSSILLAVGLAALWLLRKQPAALRHWMLAAALAIAVTQPVMKQIMPALPMPSVARAPEAITPEPVVETSVAFRLLGQGSVATPVTTPDWSQLAFMAWAAGAAISLSTLLFGALWLAWLGSRATPAGDRWQAAEHLVRTQLGLPRAVRVLVTNHPAMLVTWGAISPVILLPRDAPGWSDDRIRLVLAHEMAHLVRRDWMIQLFAEMARAINWFNPLFWLACARLRRESEYACDDIVLDLGIGGTSYASHLIDLARTFSVHGRTWLPAPSIARPSTLERRVRAMLNPQLNRRPVSSMRRAALAIAFLVLALPIAAASQAISTPQGTVSDPMGRPLADATLRLSAIDRDQVFEARSDTNGNFQFAAVPAGDYMISVRSAGFSGSRHRMRLSGGAVTISLKAQVGTLQETISVVGGGNGGGKTGPRYVEESKVALTPPTCSATAAGQLTPPMKVRDVRPRYKQEWLSQRLEGNILLEARIGPDGSVRGVSVISPVNAELEDEAIAAVSDWRFSPTYLNCEPVEVQMFVTVSFKAEQ